MAWGGAEKQEEECQKGNLEAKNWQNEVQQILEKTVCPALPRLSLADLVMLDETILEGPPNCTSTNRKPSPTKS
jgi:hypothetical protein